MKRFSQREARRLRKRVDELESQIRKQHNNWSSDWPGGVHIGSISWAARDITVARIETARKLGHAVVATDADDGKRIEFRALPLPEKP